MSLQYTPKSALRRLKHYEQALAERTPISVNDDDDDFDDDGGAAGGGSGNGGGGGNKNGRRVAIGDVSMELFDSMYPERVPAEPLLDLNRQDVLDHLQWMMQKDVLGQDMFLIGPPGPLRRRLALTYLNVVNREHEYVVLHRDTSAESDIKQRREIQRDYTSPKGGKEGLIKAEWIDQAAVRAALLGRILVIDGIEKAERNVLPVLNNLLENREINLEDGRHIIHPARYDDLLSQHSQAQLEEWKLVRASEHFRVIALGVPVPPYPGNPLDPPFRSRFQVRYVDGPLSVSGHKPRKQLFLERNAFQNAPGQESFDMDALKTAFSDGLMSKVSDVVSVVKYSHSIDDPISSTGPDMLIPQFPQTAVSAISDMFEYFPAEASNVPGALERFWPSSWVGSGLSRDQRESYQKLLQKFGVLPADKSKNSAGSPMNFSRTTYDLVGVRVSDIKQEAVARFRGGVDQTELQVSIGNLPLRAISERVVGVAGQQIFVHTARYHDIITRMAQAHALGSDICLIGTKGCGKSIAIARFASLFGYETEIVHLYKDMTARDLLQRRGTRKDGSTFWENTGLVTAALEGKIAILDGLEWVQAGTIASLQRLIHDREMVLPDGTMLTNQRNFEILMEEAKLTPKDMLARRIYPIHPSFRIVACANVAPRAPKTDIIWLTEEVGTLFMFLEIPPIGLDEEAGIIKALTNCPEAPMKILLEFASRFRALATAGSGHESVLAKSASLSTRQLIRICRRLVKFPNEDLYTSIHRTCLSPFLPSLAKQTLEDILTDSGILRPKFNKTASKWVAGTIEGNSVVIGDVASPIYQIRPDDLEAAALIPRTSPGTAKYYDNDVHTRIMRELALDFGIGEHLLLIGNQGVGKNRLTDRFLELVGRPREYIQLHRDTTVQSLMVQPTVEGGLIVYKDSPLVRAVTKGRVLIIDEADKAPTYITSILKSLAESGEMSLADGRRIRPFIPGVAMDPVKDIILHPDFRMIVLANRPGYPFLGNDFFGSIGEVFSSHAVENPDSDSEIELLSGFAPAVDRNTMEKLVHAFGDLRQAFDEGLVAYPYSLRELMAIVKHLGRYPEDPLDQVLRNVFDFDVHRKEFFEVLLAALKRHGLDVQMVGFDAVTKGKKSTLMLKYEEADLKKNKPPAAGGPKHGDVDPKGARHSGGGRWAGGSGGSNTAGLGGRGGPYRLDGGHDISQLPDDVKNDVPEHVKEAARQMGRDVLAKRLGEIQMSAFEAEGYKEVYDGVKTEIRALRVVLEGVQAKERERQWQKNQTDGDLDDSKLVEGLTGEHSIYKRRGEEVPEMGTTGKKPKRIKFVFDVSGSMYYFNRMDGRLTRSLEAALMMMESLHNLRGKFVYDMIGHSGDSAEIQLVPVDSPPQNEFDRYKVLQTMVSHAQYSWSGDNTLTAAEKAIQDITKVDADDYFVVILSDANLRRYGIRPQELGAILDSDSRVNAAVIFIGTIGEEAKYLTTHLPPGKAFVATDTREIPRIVKQLFDAINK
ncbi:hypothetical protein SmJEL517_g01076 [Synchytrium microbalum]|uniref:von Willebrand factor A domain-containing protein 8 n=1 Tax=Synchytrium microbalum TaxID=1806994 RepID=A0A507CHU4_9FUNG|nr:uncharacterized protein SmJEL517_g01076 [Synchytrium microbalum]TPX37183.1 hypothetical protein SmJEL517_g01076 [Synchytrium microbalum]